MQIRIILEEPREGYSKDVRDLSVIPGVAHVGQNETIQWTLEGSDTKSFIVFFQNETPVGQTEVHGRSASPKEAITSPPLSAKGQPRVYRYAVAVATSNAVFMDAACPEVILR